MKRFGVLVGKNDRNVHPSSVRARAWTPRTLLAFSKSLIMLGSECYRAIDKIEVRPTSDSYLKRRQHIPTFSLTTDCSTTHPDSLHLFSRHDIYHPKFKPSGCSQGFYRLYQNERPGIYAQDHPPERNCVSHPRERATFPCPYRGHRCA